jgi:hypothetical protein
MTAHTILSNRYAPIIGKKELLLKAAARYFDNHTLFDLVKGSRDDMGSLWNYNYARISMTLHESRGIGRMMKT